MPCQTSLLADKCHKTVESVAQPQEPEMCFISGKFNFSPCQTEHKTKQDMCNEKKRRQSEIMRNYRAKIKCKKVSETDRRLKVLTPNLIKQEAYSCFLQCRGYGEVTQQLLHN